MKTRYGFVSNSSSSSFICFGDKSKHEIEGIMSKIVKSAKLLDIPFSNDDYEVAIADKEYVDYIEHWRNNTNLSVGDVIIKSTDDNSIPSELFDLIENLTKSDRIHLG